MTHPNKLKGDRVERKVVQWLNTDLNLPATRTFLSAQAGRHVEYDIDLDLPVLGRKHVEVKSRKDMRNYKYVHDWLEGRDLLMLNIPDRGVPLVVMTAATFEEIVDRLKEARDADCRTYPLGSTSPVPFVRPVSASVGRPNPAGAD